jgi:hypothetical protein
MAAADLGAGAPVYAGEGGGDARPGGGGDRDGGTSCLRPLGQAWEAPSSPEAAEPVFASCHPPVSG